MNDIGRIAFERGAAIVKPYLYLAGVSPKPVDSKLNDGIALLTTCDEIHWEANWLLGKAYEAKRDFAKSAEQLEKAFQKAPGSIPVVHELALALLRIGNNARAKAILQTFGCSTNALLLFDLALVESTFASGAETALGILESNQWPADLLPRVRALRDTLMHGLNEQHALGD